MSRPTFQIEVNGTVTNDTQKRRAIRTVREQVKATGKPGCVRILTDGSSAAPLLFQCHLGENGAIVVEEL